MSNKCPRFSYQILCKKIHKTELDCQHNTASLVTASDTSLEQCRDQISMLSVKKILGMWVQMSNTVKLWSVSADLQSVKFYHDLLVVFAGSLEVDKATQLNLVNMVVIGKNSARDSSHLPRLPKSLHSFEASLTQKMVLHGAIQRPKLNYEK